MLYWKITAKRPHACSEILLLRIKVTRLAASKAPSSPMCEWLQNSAWCHIALKMFIDWKRRKSHLKAWVCWRVNEDVYCFADCWLSEQHMCLDELSCYTFVKLRTFTEGMRKDTSKQHCHMSVMTTCWERHIFISTLHRTSLLNARSQIHEQLVAAKQYCRILMWACSRREFLVSIRFFGNNAIRKEQRYCSLLI